MSIVLVVRSCVLGLLLLATRAAAGEPTRADAVPTLAARSSTGATATEYWDVTAWLESGDRFFARFLVTNRGPGVGNAVVMGHLVLADGELLPFKWGRENGDWRLERDGQRLAIAKATLELDGPTVVVTIANAKHGIDVRLEIDRDTPLVPTRPITDAYAVDVAMPSPAHGRIRTLGADVARPVSGTAAVTHTWMELPESDLLERRLDLLTRDGDTAIYVCELTREDGTRRSTVLVSRGDRVWSRTDGDVFRFGAVTTKAGDPRYPLPVDWETSSATLGVHVTVGRELVRMNPLDILPQPFRLLIALGGRPQLVWAEAAADVRIRAPAASAVHAHGTGIVLAAFARTDATR